MTTARPDAGQPGPQYDLVVISDQVVLGERVAPAGIAILGEQIAAILDADLARRPGLAARVLDLTGNHWSGC